MPTDAKRRTRAVASLSVRSHGATSPTALSLTTRADVTRQPEFVFRRDYIRLSSSLVKSRGNSRLLIRGALSSSSVNKTPAGLPNSGADGLAVDADGRLYCAALGGVQVFSSKGEHLGTIPVSLQPQNIAFAGADKKTLYIVGRGSAFKVRLLAAGYSGRAK